MTRHKVVQRVLVRIEGAAPISEPSSIVPVSSTGNWHALRMAGGCWRMRPRRRLVGRRTLDVAFTFGRRREFTSVEGARVSGSLGVPVAAAGGSLALTVPIDRPERIVALG